jgi:poly-beta-hydroxyalkanoate depolymerase
MRQLSDLPHATLKKITQALGYFIPKQLRKKKQPYIDVLSTYIHDNSLSVEEVIIFYKPYNNVNQKV